MLVTLHQITCSSCDGHSPIYDGALYTPKEIRGELRKKGWRRVRPAGLFSYYDQCPACATAGKKAA